jgi:putative transposase
MFDRSRQALHKRQQAYVRRCIQDNLILSEVRMIRRSQPRVGGRKLHKALNGKSLKIGRDRLFDLLREANMLIRMRKRHVRTTNSQHRYRKYSNLIKALEITRPNQVFVADITYIDTVEGFCYLSLLTDVYSRKIVGYALSRSLAIEGCQRALRMALRGVREPENLIHHSDRGVQYCSGGYVSMLKNKRVQISMTEEDHICENALAERVNGILKTEFMLGEKLGSFEIARALVRQAIKVYNEQRLHTSLDYQTPEQRYAA